MSTRPRGNGSTSMSGYPQRWPSSGSMAAVAAGGIVVDDSQAPSYTVLADQDGNRACVCTTLPPAGAG